MNEKTRIEIVHEDKDANGQCTDIRLHFGPHYFVSIRAEGETLKFELGATDCGFTADATEVDGELERIINKIRTSQPSNIPD